MISFILLLAAHLQIEIDYTLFEKHAAYVHNALVWASQGIYSKPEYLVRIFHDAVGLVVNGDSHATIVPKDYTHIEGYYVADYKEQPHKYLDDES